MIIKHVFDTVHNIFCLRLSQFYWFWRGLEQWAKLGELRNGGQLFWRDTKNKESLLSTLESVKHQVGAYIHFRKDRAKRRKINPHLRHGRSLALTHLPDCLASYTQPQPLWDRHAIFILNVRGGSDTLKSICVEAYRLPNTFATLCFRLRPISQVSLRFSVEKFASLPLESSVGLGKIRKFI